MTATLDVPRQRRSERLWTVADAAAFLGVPAKTLYQWRYQETGPPSHRVGRYVRYVPDEVRSWVCRQR
ncbi:helix-turn-helix transcriptional regulator [Nocardiopsis suaedae]|uniref:Helix-turn-helix domain-containing protein n=1 Tax=Nocardiopsis suaedae TaxID=3018444 RepID=A0ABT4TIT7_9ACTN|nr:helix-turn-helix domain-containing protein [Nocardiopsis suaedae]MDA2804581.1 helix-turn-helix domain-containing protein [Nocardiopsis suaedae]